MSDVQKIIFLLILSFSLTFFFVYVVPMYAFNRGRNVGVCTALCDSSDVDSRSASSGGVCICYSNDSIVKTEWRY